MSILKMKPREVGSLTPKEENALDTWEYFDCRCDYCGSWVPEFAPYIWDAWTPEEGKLPEKVYCSPYCYHTGRRTEWYEQRKLPNQFDMLHSPGLKF